MTDMHSTAAFACTLSPIAPAVKSESMGEKDQEEAEIADYIVVPLLVMYFLIFLVPIHSFTCVFISISCRSAW